MVEVTREMILEYMQSKGGVVKNVDLVRNFRKYLQLSDQRAKGLCGAVCLYSRPVLRPLKNNTGRFLERQLSFWSDFKASLLAGGSLLCVPTLEGSLETFVVPQSAPNLPSGSVPAALSV